MSLDNPFFDKNDTEHLSWSNHLPHWHQDEKYVFVTFRLADSLPQDKLNELRDEKLKWEAHHPSPRSEKDEHEYYQKFGSVIDKWLDNNYGACILQKDENRIIVENALHFYDRTRYDLISYVVMPNHVHLLVRALGDKEILSTIYSIKNFTAKELNKNTGSRGRVWQSESFDRIIRDEEHLKRVIHYIVRNNPRLAWVRGV